MTTKYIIQTWDKFNRQWEAAGDTVDALCDTLAEAEEGMAELAEMWECPPDELRVMPVSDTRQLERLTLVTPLVGDPKYEALFLAPLSREAREAEFKEAVAALSPGAREGYYSALALARYEGFEAGRREGLREARGGDNP